LTQAGKEVVRSHAAYIVKHAHFTPERIRRLVEELVPSLPKDVTKQAVQNQIAEALTNPTKQMRVTFRKLPVCHRWLLFALLEADHMGAISVALGGSAQSIHERYEALCPSDDQQPFNKVLGELTEAFVKKSPSLFAAEIGWIHPSCRDLAIEELAQSRRDKQRFLAHCSEAGLLLASSLAGGATGARQLPLLQNDDDWADFASRAKQLIAQRPQVLRVIWFNYEQMQKQAVENLELRRPSDRLKSILQDTLIHVAAQHTGSFAYSDTQSFRTLFEICQALRVNPTIDLSEAWGECIEDAQRWLNDRWVIWQDDTVPGRTADFVRTIHEFYPSEFQRPEIREKLQRVITILLERAGEEYNSDYEDPDGEDEIKERVGAFESVGKAFKRLSELPLWEKREQVSLRATATHFAYQANNLREDLPGEPDSDGDSSYQRPSGEDMDIGELFRDL
jgi:hypothetical protein